MPLYLPARWSEHLVVLDNTALSSCVAPGTMDPFDTHSNASSRLTSPASRSPSPPSEFRFQPYPTPLSSDQSSQESSPAPDDMSSKRSLEEQDDSKPAKKRKMSQPKPRGTEHLHLESAKLKDSEKEQLDKLLKILYKKRKIVVVAGAGISVSAGSMSLMLPLPGIPILKFPSPGLSLI